MRTPRNIGNTAFEWDPYKFYLFEVYVQPLSPVLY